MSYVVHDEAAMADRVGFLLDLFKRWSSFLVDGFDAIGACWDFGMHFHDWSCTPTRNMVFTRWEFCPPSRVAQKTASHPAWASYLG